MHFLPTVVNCDQALNSFSQLLPTKCIYDILLTNIIFQIGQCPTQNFPFLFSGSEYISCHVLLLAAFVLLTVNFKWMAKLDTSTHEA